MTARIVLSFITALIVAATAYLCAWRSFRELSALKPNYQMTRRALAQLHAALEEHKRATGAWPASLRDLMVVKEQEMWVNEVGDPLDGWGRPFQYRVEGNDYLLHSLERTGHPEIPIAVALPRKPSLVEFSTAPVSTPAWVASLLAGLITFPLCLFNTLRRSSRTRVLAEAAATAALAIVGALMLAAIHYMPGGH